MAARPHMFRREWARSVRGSLGRFLAIMGISALGCGFYAGLQMSGPDMRASADRWYDGTRLWDLRVVSTLGLWDDDVARIAEVEGVEQVSPARSCDVMVSHGNEQVAARIMSIDDETARASRVEGLFDVVSDDEGYLNRPMLREGRWPEADGECVVAADAVGGFDVGDTVEVLYGSSSLDDVLAVRSFSVVGTVSSSDYPYTGSFGSTTLGSGALDEYLFVRDGAFDDDVPYAEAYVRVAGAADEASESEAYEAVVDQTKAGLEDREGALAAARQSDLKEDAQAELDEKRAEYEEEKAEAESELADAAAKLDDALAELRDGEAAYEDGRAQFESGAAALASRRADAESQLADGQAQIDAGQAELDARKSQLAAQATQVEEARAGVSQLEAGVAQAAAAEEDLSSKRDALLAAQAQRGELAAAVEALKAAKAQAEAAGGSLPAEQLAQLEALSAQLAELDAQLAQLPALEEGLSQAQQTRAALEEQLAQARAAVDAYDQGAAQIAQAQATLDASRAELASKRADAEAQLASAQSELDAAESELVSSRAKLDDGWAEYRSGKADYAEARADADAQFAEAEHDLAEAQATIDEIELPDIYVLDRTQSEGAATYHADAGRIDSIADVFPLMFFLVAALVSLTTMTRMVEDDRIEIGTYKALGYGMGTIAAKYLAYAAFAAVTGAVVGIVVLSQVLPYIITSSYAIIYAVPILPLPLPIDLGIAFSAGGLGVGVTLLATWAAVASTMRSTPATLMLPRAPKPGKRILLERIGPLWRRLSFSWKVTARNLFRYKRRFAMTVIGIAGCTALLLVGFGLHDAIWDIIDRQYGPIIHYDTTVGLDGGSTQQEVDAVAAYVADEAGGANLVSVRHENMLASSDGHESTMRVQIVVPKSADELAGAVTFKDRLTQDPVAFGDNQVLINEKTASLLGVGPGDEVRIYEQDDIGNAAGEPGALVITGVVESYVGNVVYVGRDAWHELDAALAANNAEKTGDVPGEDGSNDDLVFSTLYFERDPAADKDELSAALHDLTGVSTVLYTDETIDTYRSMLTVVDLIVVVLIVSAAALALIVLYNLTNINIGERVREIASLKVLGFTQREVYAYIFRETGLLALIGDLLGMVLGTYLARFVVTTAEVDYVMFGRSIHAPSYAYAFCLTLVFTVLVLMLMRHKLDRVDMVESLKSVD